MEHPESTLSKRFVTQCFPTQVPNERVSSRVFDHGHFFFKDIKYIEIFKLLVTCKLARALTLLKYNVASNITSPDRIF